MTDHQNAAEFERRCRDAGVHTVEIATPDTLGHLRGKRIPIDRFFSTTVRGGVNIADAIFIFDAQNDLVDNPYINMDSGFLDCVLVPEISTGRIFTHRPGYAIVFADVYDPHGEKHPNAPRNVLKAQVERCAAQGLSPVVATELEFYLCNLDWTPVQSHIQYSSLTDGMALEDIIAEMRAALLGVGMEVESSNPEYGPGQFEINVGHADAVTTADNTVLLKSIIKQVAQRHGLRATFMPKPYAEESGSGMHIHTSLSDESGKNAFASSSHEPNELMSHWIAGLLDHARSMTLIGSPNANAVKRIRPYTFCPTHVNWGGDNRTVLVRCITEPDSPANRTEFRSPGADANPYLMIAAIMAAGTDGVERKLALEPMAEGDAYTDPGDAPTLPTTLPECVEAFQGSSLAEQMGEQFSTVFALFGQHENELGEEHAPDAETVNDWERARYAEHG